MVLIFLIVAMSPEFTSVFNHGYPGPGNMHFKDVFTAGNTSLVGDESVQIDVGPAVSNLDEQAGLTFLI